MTPLCKIEVTHPRVLGSREVRRGGVVDEQAGVQPPDVRLRFQSGRLRVTDACVLISLQRHQVFRLLRGLIGMTQRRQLPLGAFEYPPATR